MDNKYRYWRGALACVCLAVIAVLVGAYQYVGRAQGKEGNLGQEPFSLCLGYEKDQVLTYEGTARVLVERDHVKDVPPTRETEMDYSWKIATKDYVLNTTSEEVTILSAVNSDLVWGLFRGQKVSASNKGLRLLKIRRDGSTVASPDYCILWGPMVANPNYGLLPTPLPSKKVSVGERWSSETEPRVGGSMIRQSADTAAMGLEYMEGRRAVKLVVSWGPVPSSRGGRERAQEVVWLDAESGILVGLDSEFVRESTDDLHSVTTKTSRLRLKDVHTATPDERAAKPVMNAIARAYLQVTDPFPARSADAAKRLASALGRIAKAHRETEYGERARWQSEAFLKRSTGRWEDDGGAK